MPVQYVRIYYGPYKSFYTLSHKPQKLRGLKDHLQKLGFRVDLVPVEFCNYCMIAMCGYEVCLKLTGVQRVFRCNINNLCFNTPAEQDPVCQRAINAVVASSTKLARARDYLWFWSLLEDQIFRREEFAPKDKWINDVDLKTIVKPLECFICCTSLAPCKDDVEP